MMRADKLVLIAGFLFGAPALPQNIVPIPAPSFPADLRQYLSLTDTQMPRADDRRLQSGWFLHATTHLAIADRDRRSKSKGSARSDGHRRPLCRDRIDPPGPCQSVDGLAWQVANLP